MKRMIMCAATLFICATAQAQEAKRSDIEIFFLRTQEFVGKSYTVVGQMSMADPTSALLSVPADRLGSKTVSLKWKDTSGNAWEEAQLQCGSASIKNQICKKVRATGIVTANEYMKDSYYLTGVEYEFVK